MRAYAHYGSGQGPFLTEQVSYSCLTGVHYVLLNKRWRNVRDYNEKTGLGHAMVNGEFVQIQLVEG